jgi:hypothetical protein
MNDVPKPVKPLLPFTRPSIDEETIAAVANRCLSVPATD